MESTDAYRSLSLFLSLSLHAHAVCTLDGFESTKIKRRYLNFHFHFIYFTIKWFLSAYQKRQCPFSLSFSPSISVYLKLSHSLVLLHSCPFFISVRMYVYLLEAILHSPIQLYDALCGASKPNKANELLK